MDIQQYYPTPLELGRKLARLIKLPVSPILEPSAGTGELADAFNKIHSHGWRGNCIFHCIEIDSERAATLKGKDYIVVWDDFLTFNPLMPYQTIIMNPPFHNGAKHFHKALNILADGGEIVCILNAETIRNPYNNERKDLIARLESMENYTVEFVQSAFEGVNVEVALVYARKAPADGRCETFENFKRSVVEEYKHADPTALIQRGGSAMLIALYRAEVQAALKLFDEIQNFNRIANKDAKYGGDEVFEIKIKHGDGGRLGIVKALNYNYWKRLLYNEELSSLLTADIQNLYSAKLREMENYEFNERNILQLKEDLLKNLLSNIDVAIMKVWDNFTHRFSMTEYSKNIHYYNGWKTNKAFKCNHKVIIPLYAFDHISDRIDLFRVRSELSDIEKAMNYLDCGRTDGSDMFERLMSAKDSGQTRGIDTKYFRVDIFKKNTCHLTFKDSDLLKKFNLYCGRKLNWLPDGYGTKPYESLDDEERAVADSFEGRDSYQDTFRNRQFYLPQPSQNLLMLTSGSAQVNSF